MTKSFSFADPSVFACSIVDAMTLKERLKERGFLHAKRRLQSLPTSFKDLGTRQEDTRQPNRRNQGTYASSPRSDAGSPQTEALG